MSQNETSGEIDRATLDHFRSEACGLLFAQQKTGIYDTGVPVPPKVLIELLRGYSNYTYQKLPGAEFPFWTGSKPPMIGLDPVVRDVIDTVVRAMAESLTDPSGKE